MYEVVPEYAQTVIAKIVQSPSKGYLTNGSVRIRAGDVFSLADIQNGSLKYTHTSNLIELEETDSFKFVLLSLDGVITGDSYSVCMIEELSLEVPIDGVYEFVITIVGSSKPSILVSSVVEMYTEETINVTSEYLSSFSTGFSSSEIVYNFDETEYGTFLYNDKPIKTFTQYDVNSGNVFFKSNTLVNLVNLTYLVSNAQSKSVSGSIGFNIKERFEFVGDNVFYAQILSELNLVIETNRDNVVFFLKSGDTVLPVGVITEPQDDVIPFTEYNYYGDTAATIGKGYNKLERFWNYKNVTYWNAGLPYGISFNSRGELVTNLHFPAVTDGSEKWVLPAIPQAFIFTLIATDTITGETIERDYSIITSYEGLGPNGESSMVI